MGFMQYDQTVFKHEDCTKFYGYIHKWYEGFKSIVQGMLESGKKVYIIAISRKMPRFIDWLISKSGILQLEGLEELLSSSKFTTEHALPFLFSRHEDISRFEIVVIDDSIVTGNTMRRIVNDVMKYSCGKRPYVSAIVTESNAMLDLINAEGRFLPTTVLQEEANNWLKFVAHANYECELPIDIVFPIFYLDNACESDYIDVCRKNFTDQNWYIIEGSHSQKSINMLLDEQLANKTLLDFSKGRCYFGVNTVKLAVFSPHAVCTEEFDNPHLFINEHLNKAWFYIRAKVQDPHETRTSSSLVVLINYLHAINTFLRNKSLLIPNEKIKYEIHQKDLDLLVGNEMSYFFFQCIVRSLYDDYEDALIYQKVLFPSINVPENLANSYYSERTLTAARHSSGSDIEMVMEDLFDQARYDKSILGQNTTLFHRMHSSFSESFESIETLLRLHFSNQSFHKAINRKLDQLIDKGKVIPVYECVNGDDGYPYWKRYFRSAYSSVEL